MQLSAKGAAAEELFVRTISGLTALVASYVLSFVAVAFLIAPFIGGGWSVFVAVGGAFVGLPFLAIAALGFLIFDRAVCAHPGRCCLAAPLVITAAWLAVDYGIRHGLGSLPFLTYLTRDGSREATFVLVTSSLAAAAFHVVEPLIRRRIERTRRRRRDPRA